MTFLEHVVRKMTTSTQAATPQVDRAIAVLRWLLLLGALGYALYVGQRPTSPPELTEHINRYMPFVLVAGAAYAALATVAFWVWPARSHHMAGVGTLVLDAILALGLYWAAGGDALLLLPLALFPLLVAWLRYGVAAGGAATVALIAAALLAFLVSPAGEQGLSDGAILAAGCLGFVSAAVGVLHHRVAADARSLSTPRIAAEVLNATRERTRAIYEMAATLNATLDYNKVLDIALDMGAVGLRDAGPDVRLVSCVMLFRDDVLYVATARGLTRADRQVVVEGKSGVLGEALRQAEPVFATDPRNDPELRYFAAFQACRSLLIVPLRAGFDTYGVLLFGASPPDAFGDESVELLSAIGTQATIALQNAALYRNVMEEKERIVEVEEEARKKLARDLHDGPTQGVAAIAMRVNYIRRLIERNPAGVPDELWKVEELARKTTKEIRHLLFTLRPLVLESQGLVPALAQLAEKMKDTHDQNVIVQAKPGVGEMLDEHAQGVIFYIVEEAVNNARKHAEAEHIWVRLYTRGAYLVLEVQDDGVGFDLEAMKAGYETRGSQSLGLVNMRERAELAEGQLLLESAPGKGTTVRVLIPLDSHHVVRPAPDGQSGNTDAA